MDWITGISKAIDYIEEHITEPTDYARAAKEACSSPFNFQRVFALLCGYTLGDYVRMRRLTLAGEELLSTDAKVIDVALKYGYDSPESFSRAFTRFHGVSPSAVRKGAAIRSFSRICVKLILTGGSIMEYRIEKKQAAKIICRRREFTKPGDDYTNREIPEFWNECGRDGSIQKLCGYIKDSAQFKGLLGVCFSTEMTDSGFPYGIGAEYDGESDPQDFEIVEIPAYTYAVFTVRGRMPDAFRETYRKICTEFFPQSGYEYGNGVEIEVYPSADVQNPDYTCEIWIAVKPKK
ncbi:MAG: AraC family transcriptional regulator [Oscillospiraceae bacterium]|nr:AraC family transcriptional regulator [Oscillospiraceae bacterium]MCI7487418.1 AraC family transcriptional regulator [Oscillospiraceae bacterium]MCI7528312.1 AraC family transcriptional regulator [Oscillospiraceae bacterium]